MAEEAAIETAEAIEAQYKTAAITTKHTNRRKHNPELGPYMAGLIETDYHISVLKEFHTVDGPIRYCFIRIVFDVRDKPFAFFCSLSCVWLCPYPSLNLLSLLSLQTGRVSAACSCCQMYSHWTWTGLDWMALPRLLPPKGAVPWRPSCKMILQGRKEQTRF